MCDWVPVNSLCLTDISRLRTKEAEICKELQARSMRSRCPQKLLTISTRAHDRETTYPAVVFAVATQVMRDWNAARMLFCSCACVRVHR